MGANPWHYFIPYQVDINAALQNLREQEFQAGHYGFDYWFNQTSSALRGNTSANVSNIFKDFSEVINQPKPSADKLLEKYGSVQAAMENVLEESAPAGTKSILDMIHISDQPEICAACPLSENDLQAIFETTEPTRRMIEAILLNEDGEPWETFWDSIGRGEGRYIIVYENAQPTELFFAGYSFD